MTADAVPEAVSGGAATGSLTPAVRAVAVARPVVDLLRGAGCVARVHSAFPRAINLLIGQRLLALTSVGAPTVPNGISLACQENHPALLGVRPGQEAWVGDGEISFPQSGLRVVTGHAELWEPSLAEHLDLVDAIGLARGLQHLAAILTGASAGRPSQSWHHLLRAPVAGIDLHLLRQRLTDGVDRLAAGLARGDPSEVVSSARGLAGLGPGLTPAGDDLLVGACVALSLIASANPAATRSVERLLYLRQLVAAVALARTTALSAVWLEHAGTGEFAQPVLALAQALASGQAREVTVAAATLMRYGASSGRCTLGGLLAIGQALTARLSHVIGAR